MEFSETQLHGMRKSEIRSFWRFVSEARRLIGTDDREAALNTVESLATIVWITDLGGLRRLVAQHLGSLASDDPRGLVGKCARNSLKDLGCGPDGSLPT